MDSEEMLLKDRILDASIEAFNEKGARLTLSDVSKKLNISKKTIYTIFESKEALLSEMIEVGFQSVKRHEQKILEDSSLGIVEKIKQIVIIIPEKYKNVDYRKFITIKERYPKLYKRIQEHIETEWEPTIDLIEKGMTEGLIRKVPIPILKTMIEASMERFLEKELESHPEYSYVNTLDWMMNILMYGIENDRGAIK